MKPLCTTLAIIAGLCLLLGFLGFLHPVFDALAIGRKVAICAVFFFLSLRAILGRRLVLGTLALSLFTLAAAISRFPGDGEAGSVRIYTKNLWHANQEVASIVTDIQQMKPDVVFLQEVSRENNAVMSELQASFPYQALCPWQGWNGIAILSRWPLSNDTPRCSPQRSLMAVKVMRPEGSFWAVGVHLQQPWPDVQWLHLEQALSVIEGLDEGAIVAGDFNTVPWSAAARRIGQLTGTTPVHPQKTTFHLWGVGLPLDQVWALGGWTQIRPLIGSDHFGVVADVWPSEGGGLSR